jgi:hypothetical protein
MLTLAPPSFSIEYRNSEEVGMEVSGIKSTNRVDSKERNKLQSPKSRNEQARYHTPDLAVSGNCET